MRQFTTALLILIAFCASAATEADLIAAGRAALDRGELSPDAKDIADALKRVS
jgi:hypothetical protein